MAQGKALGVNPGCSRPNGMLVTTVTKTRRKGLTSSDSHWRTTWHRTTDWLVMDKVRQAPSNRTSRLEKTDCNSCVLLSPVVGREHTVGSFCGPQCFGRVPMTKPRATWQYPWFTSEHDSSLRAHLQVRHGTYRSSHPSVRGLGTAESQRAVALRASGLRCAKCNGGSAAHFLVFPTGVGWRMERCSASRRARSRPRSLPLGGCRPAVTAAFWRLLELCDGLSPLHGKVRSHCRVVSRRGRASRE